MRHIPQIVITNRIAVTKLLVGALLIEPGLSELREAHLKKLHSVTAQNRRSRNVRESKAYTYIPRVKKQKYPFMFNLVHRYTGVDMIEFTVQRQIGLKAHQAIS
jgi:hypothetical protein